MPATDRDQILLDRLNGHPRWRARMENLLEVVEDAAGDCEPADAAERRVIEERRQMGNEALTAWAERGVEKRVALAAPALALCALAMAGAASAQGIYPGDPAKDAYKLPGDFEPILKLRTFYFDQQNPSGAPNVSWALGGWAGLRSPWWGGLFQAGIVGYTSQKLYGPAGEGGTGILTPTQGSITVLGETFGALRLAGQTITGGRQLINRPFINPIDNRMVPNTFEAYTITGAIQDVSYFGGYITKVKLRDADSFQWMSNVAGGTGNPQGVAFAGATYSFGKTGYGRLDAQYGIDVYNTIYTDVQYPIAIGEATSLTLGGQYYRQYSVGAEQIGSFSTWGSGLRAALAHGPFGVQLYAAQTGRGYDILYPFGWPGSYLSVMQQSYFITAGEKAWGIGANVDFAAIGAPGLTAAAIYADGRDLINSTTKAPLPNQNETDVRVDYTFSKGSVLDGLSATFRYSWLNQAQQTTTQLRTILNYEVRF